MTTELMKAFDFTAEDLSYNKMGKLSPGQAARFSRKKGTGIVVFIILTLAAGIGAFFMLQPFLLNGVSISENTGSFIGGCVLAGLTLLFLYFSFQTDGPVIQKAQGKAQFISREENRTDAEGHTTHETGYYVLIGDHEFSVDRDKVQAFEQGHIYTVYNENFLTGILSVEYNGPSTN
ncbi:MAG TPA: hypothetical protein VJ972_10295 [Anaerolineales bacterium]|nr:hypothetical protein [Anaerolineales bacterium]